jgi:hypothetical protein
MIRGSKSAYRLRPVEKLPGIKGWWMRFISDPRNPLDPSDDSGNGGLNISWDSAFYIALTLNFHFANDGNGWDHRLRRAECARRQPDGRNRLLLNRRARQLRVRIEFWSDHDRKLCAVNGPD